MKCFNVLLVALLISLAAAIAGSPTVGTVTCPSSGTSRIASSQLKFVTGVIQAPSGNTGKVYFGSSAVTTSLGVYLGPSDSYNFPTQGNAQPYDLNQTYIACTVNTDTLTYTVWQ